MAISPLGHLGNSLRRKLMRISGQSRPRRRNRPSARRLEVEQLEDRMLLNASPAGPEFLVNTFNLDNQQTFFESPQAVAMDTDGDFVVSWSSLGQDGDDWGIYGQRYNAAGVAQGIEFQVNTYTTDEQRYSAVAMDAAGNFVITWSSRDQDGADWGIYGQRYNAAGVPQRGEFRVNTTATRRQELATVAMDSDGDFVVVWSGNGPGDGSGVFAQRYDAAGVPQAGEFRVNDTTVGIQQHARVAMDDAGNFVVTWSSNAQDGGGWGIYAQRYNAAGEPQGGEFLVNSNTAGNQQYSTVAMESDGDFVVSWSSNGQDGGGWGVYAQRYNAAGLLQGGEFRVNTTTTGNQQYSSVAMDADGDFVVSWSSLNQDGDLWGVYAQQYSAAGVPQGSEFLVNTTTAGTQRHSSLAGGAAGDFVVVWSGNGPGDGDQDGMFGQRYEADVSVTNNDGDDDNDTSALTVNPTSGLVTTETGSMATFTVVLESAPTGGVTVALSSSYTTEGTVAPVSLSFTAEKWSVAQTVKVIEVEDLHYSGLGETKVSETDDGTAQPEQVASVVRNSTALTNSVANNTAGNSTDPAPLIDAVLELEGAIIALKSEFLWDQLSKATDQINSSDTFALQDAAMAAGVGAVVSTGYVIWTTRAGSALVSALPSMPLWSQFDPLEVLKLREKKFRRRASPTRKR